MRIVDVAARPGHAFEGSDEAWVVQESALGSEPLESPGSTQAGERPVVVLIPGDVGVIRDRLSRWAGAGAPRIARIHPGVGGHGYPLVDWLLPPLPEVLDRDGWALGVDPGDSRPYPWEPLVALARRYPALPVVALGAPLGDRTAMRALDSTGNLLLAVAGGLDDRALTALALVVRQAGAHRVVAGSGARSGAPPLPTGLDTDALTAMASGTADAIGSGRWRDQWL